MLNNALVRAQEKFWLLDVKGTTVSTCSFGVGVSNKHRPVNLYLYALGPDGTLRTVPMEKTDVVSIAQKIIYRNYLPQWRCLCVIIIFSFSLPTLSSSSNESVA